MHREAVGNALRFDGVDDHVTIANEQAFDITDRITVSAWIKVDSFTKAWQAVVTKGDTAWRLHRNNSTDVLKFNCDGAGSVAGSTNVNDGFWHHVAGVYDGSSICFYVDGDPDGSSAASGTVNVNDYPVCIGDNAEATGRTFQGLIDDVRIYDRALSPSEIDGLHNMGLKAPTITSAPPTTANVGQLYSYTVTLDGYPGPCVAVSGLPAWLSFDSGSNTVSGTPQASDVGFTGTIPVTAGNGVEPDSTQTFAVAVTVPWLDPSWGCRLKVVSVLRSFDVRQWPEATLGEVTPHDRVVVVVKEVVLDLSWELQKVHALRHAWSAHAEYLSDLRLGGYRRPREAFGVTLCLEYRIDALEEVGVCLAMAFAETAMTGKLARLAPHHKCRLALPGDLVEWSRRPGYLPGAFATGV